MMINRSDTFILLWKFKTIIKLQVSNFNHFRKLDRTVSDKLRKMQFKDWEIKTTILFLKNDMNLPLTLTPQ